MEVRKHLNNALLARYTYSGLGQRISEQTDTQKSTQLNLCRENPDGVVDIGDPVYFMAVDRQGRRIATFGLIAEPRETFVWHAPGLSGQDRGPSPASGPILRDRITEWCSSDDPAIRPERFYYLSDFGRNVTALVSSGGGLIEQYRYSATGVPMGIPLGDVTADCAVKGGSAKEGLSAGPRLNFVSSGDSPRVYACFTDQRTRP